MIGSLQVSNSHVQLTPGIVNSLLLAALCKPQDGIQYRYCDLMCRFEDTLLARARAAGLDSSFPATVGINGFRGCLDEFVKKLESKELPEVKVKKAAVKPKKKKEHKEAFIVSSCCSI